MALRLIAVHAHPDDESSKGAATYAHYLDQGAEVLIVSCTGGERGDILNEAVLMDPESHRDIAGVRRREMARAQEIIGFDHVWLGYEDSGLPPAGDPVPPLSFADVPAEVSAEALVRIVREFKPHVMITYNEIGGYPHPDHIRCHEISKIAWDRSGDPASYPDAGPAWEIKKLYYEEIFHVERFSALYQALVATSSDPETAARLAEILERFKDRPYQGTAKIEISNYLEQRDLALRAHASQVSPESSFFFWPNEVQREAWPFEDFRLAASRVPTAQFEADLFQGITA
ncbi:mycothiol conjugate amidase Mca [Leucobacter sp. OH1287]|uniref:mycothiol conjugate amidase Mca n=1 Tax=Leucobacter sp. OH1287 TaxID=2491049 RepID=UPI000F5E56C7|nr:mycothiol conjugate amidase Mca [Leucobacter sp. OH1287]RRD60037.1 mycothiol conjugate amidase Mca [Leucobacter sp. OH1287]